MKKLLALSLVCMLAFTGCGKNGKDNGDNKPNEEKPEIKEETQVNTNTGVVEDKVLGEFKFTNTSMIYEKSDTTLETTVTNTSATTSYLKEFIITAKDAEGKTVATLKGFVGDNIPAGESRVITSSISMDLTKAASISYEVVR